MAKQTFRLKRDDLNPDLQATLLDDTGAAIDLSTGGTVVKFSMRLEGAATNKVNKQTATIVNATAGIVKYAWQSGDTDTAGAYDAEFEIDHGGTGQLQTVPVRSGDLKVVITADLG